MDASILNGKYLESVPAFFGARAPEKVFFAGNENLLDKKKIALFVSINCPGAMIFQSYDFVFKLRTRKNISFISGFHSPMEKECLGSIAAGASGIIWCVAKSITSFKLPEELQKAYDDGRVLILSSFPEKVTRITKQTAMERNKLVAAIADELFFSYATPGGKTEKLCCNAIDLGKSVFTLKSEENEKIINHGAMPIDVNNVLAYWPKEDRDTDFTLET